MKICPLCEAGYPDQLDSCPTHGGLLSEIRDLRPGMLVRGTYRIIRKLGSGNMGQVYLAQHILLDEPQVLKFLSPELSHDQAWTRRFLREIRALRQIHHRNVVTAGNLEPAEDGTLFFTMEFVDGPDLFEFCRLAPKPFDVGLALEIARGVALGLGAAHAVGVVHRDIKPENILIAREGSAIVPKIADFGIAATREQTRLTNTGTALLTAQFAAPEQWRGAPTNELDGRADLYALGGVLFEMLTGRCAFEADNFLGWMNQHLHAQPPAPSALRADLAEWPGLDELVLCLLSKDPGNRPPNVEEMLGFLDGIRHVPAIHQLPPPAPAEPMPVLDAHLGQAEEPKRASHRVRIVDSPLPGVEPAPRQSRPGKRLSVPSRVAPRSDSKRSIFLAVTIAVVLVLAAVGLLIRHAMANPIDSQVLTQQHDAIFAVAFAPNGLELASASRDNTVQFWKLAGGRPLGSIPAAVTALAYSPDGHTLAAGMADDSVNLWDAAHGTVLATLSGHTGAVNALAYSPDGHTLATASADKTIRLWDAATGTLKNTLTGAQGELYAIAWSADGHTLASAGSEMSIRLWDPALGVELRQSQGHTLKVNALAFSPDGLTLASASDDRSIRLWSVSTGQTLRVLNGHTAAVSSLVLSPDGRILASGSADSTVRLWDEKTGQMLRTLNGHTGPVLSVAFSPYGYTVASGSADKTIRVWDLTSLHN